MRKYLVSLVVLVGVILLLSLSIARKPVEASASSTLNFGVQSLQFRSGVVDFELPVDAALLGVGLVGPDPNL